MIGRAVHGLTVNNSDRKTTTPNGTRSAAEREIGRIEVRRNKLVESIMDGVPASEVRDELSANAVRREELKAELAAAEEPPPLLHPGMADLYGQKVTALAHIQKPARKPPRRCVASSTPRSFSGRTSPRPIRRTTASARAVVHRPQEMSADVGGTVLPPRTIRAALR